MTMRRTSEGVRGVTVEGPKVGGFEVGGFKGRYFLDRIATAASA
jgi:hypothetical protein